MNFFNKLRNKVEIGLKEKTKWIFILFLVCVCVGEGGGWVDKEWERAISESLSEYTFQLFLRCQKSWWFLLAQFKIIFDCNSFDNPSIKNAKWVGLFESMFLGIQYRSFIVYIYMPRSSFDLSRYAYINIHFYHPLFMH